MSPTRIYEWGKAAAVVGGIVWGVFVAASNARQKIDAVPTLQQDVSTLKGEMTFVVHYVEQQSGQKYQPAGEASR